MDGSGLDGSVTVTAGSYEQAFPRTISCHETHRDGAQVTQALGRLPVVMSAEQDVNLAAGVSVAVGECNEDSRPRSAGQQHARSGAAAFRPCIGEAWPTGWRAGVFERARCGNQFLGQNMRQAWPEAWP